MATLTQLRIVVLQTKRDLWCDRCVATCAVQIIYVVEESGRVPNAVGGLTYCEVCEQR
ncbi:hypothetical protein [Actinocatenispora comari]|jgi:hypothetical protein|uniref:Uncharacterized protein n=1 Tax=Actinocatenispora comari TaxID=2807577 RepID=A0A8J4A8U3_9ACTN|nr:hypothetical protein [Actinocatenispora comari]GIL25430.1 hypothetical protein NUM_06850 [Actinocatenispora comari]